MLTDVNVLVYANREDTPDHRTYRAWLLNLVNGDAAYAVSGPDLSGFLRVVTQPKVFNTPSTIGQALAFTDQIRSRPNTVPVEPGARHWEIFGRLCLGSRVDQTE